MPYTPITFDGIVCHYPDLLLSYCQKYWQCTKDEAHCIVFQEKNSINAEEYRKISFFATNLAKQKFLAEKLNHVDGELQDNILIMVPKVSKTYLKETFFLDDYTGTNIIVSHILYK